MNNMNNYFEIAAFTTDVFGGNIAAVQLLDRPIAPSLMQQLAAQNKQTETAFVVLSDTEHHIRWFTPSYEIDLCGHATLAAAFVLDKLSNGSQEQFSFTTATAGPIAVRKNSLGYSLDFPARPGKAIPIPAKVEEAFGYRPKQAFQSRDMLLIFEDQEQIEHIRPNPSVFKDWDTLGVICTAPGNQVDFVSRVFDANDYHLEDPVTGSAHCTLAPYWSNRLDKTILTATQLSKRRGELHCRLVDDRVYISGSAVLYKEGFVPMDHIRSNDAHIVTD